jgi:hypothetical protein
LQRCILYYERNAGYIKADAALQEAGGARKGLSIFVRDGNKHCFQVALRTDQHNSNLLSCIPTNQSAPCLHSSHDAAQGCSVAALTQQRDCAANYSN